ncbi:GNAT family N-acetyltransferase [Kribbella qitaiheensis]|uniref:GNAT family N-acetyltransferase n=1 Tax=Kribbella qitaiheensis TaxID=1544730 RepID=A0A7G6X659_9ACTN|nr:GNAT family N-acetyltransferase [Kribbella qitaiheensis]QNE21724.1 GNAT family N-acetyltransferase [Kribbella qitaiheensis]
MITAREIDPYNEPLFDEWYAVLREGASADSEAAIVTSHEAMAFSLRDPTTVKTRVPVGAFDGERIVGSMLFEYRLQDNLDTVEVEIDVPPAERRRGVGTALWAWATARAEELGRTIFQTEFGAADESAPGMVFATGLGFKVEHVEDHFVVPLPYDEARLEALRKTAGELDGYRLTSWAGICPPEYLQMYADLRTAMDRDVPTGGMTHELVPWTVERLQINQDRMFKNYLALVTMAQTMDGAPAGYTLMFLPRESAEFAQQDDTLVLRDHRGHNLGTHLKLANLDQLAKHRSTQVWLHTWTSLTNAPMQKVNERFGFRPVERYYELELTAG